MSNMRSLFPPPGGPGHVPPPHGHLSQGPRPPPQGPPGRGPPPHDLSREGRAPPHGPPRNDLSGEGPPHGAPGLPNVIFQILQDQEQLKQFIPKLKELHPMFPGSVGEPNSNPFKTVVHNDMWVNNTMQTSENGKLVKNKFVDFQMYSCGSPAQDVVFFIWSSVQLDVVKKNFDTLLKFYFDQFLENLEELCCDVSFYSFDKFIEEVASIAPHEWAHICMMCMVIFGKKGVAAFSPTGPPDSDMFKIEDVTENAKARIINATNFFVNRGWIK